MTGHLNYDEIGKAICKVGKRTIYISDKPVEDGFDSIVAKGDNIVSHIPDKETERSILYVTAPSGSGKSYYTREYISEYHRMYPKRPIIVFSALDSCETLDKLKYLKRININKPDFLSIPLSAEDFKESLVIMDDVDSITDKNIKKKVYSILTSINNTGRHFKVSLIFTSHVACSGNETKSILNESHSLTVFVKNMGGKMSKYLLENYLGLDKEEIKRIKNVKDSRYITIVKSYPMVFFSNKEVWCRTNT
jgi:hypothetical protein